MAVSTYLSIITLKISGLNALVKRYRLVDWTKITRPSYMLLTKDSLQR